MYSPATRYTVKTYTTDEGITLYCVFDRIAFRARIDKGLYPTREEAQRAVNAANN